MHDGPSDRVRPVLVTGGTGTLGRHVVARLRARGHEVRVLSRQGRTGRTDLDRGGAGLEVVRGDLATGEGIDAAVAGTGVIVHCAGSAKGDEEKARHLVRAAVGAGAQHLVFISVVGADRIPATAGLDRAMFGYYASQLAAERVVADSGLPWTTLRASQFHDLILATVRQMSRLPAIPVPSGFRFQPVEAGEVAGRLTDLALAPPAGHVPDMAGPQIHELGDLARGYLRAHRTRRPIVPVRIPGRAARAFRDGANLAPDRAVGELTWEAFLAARHRESSDPALRTP
ncbi:NAD-dependent epimerase/dehydratase family protein [Egibacter rhizosphaerae]|uniref:NAD-dependent epimerase/dehydratase family protein n=1 Tax=Egibacter rhizosphaerae TaxID=1670831 RepID=A0A411YB23_9ACTN|nr:NAD(P)H-binding protein [Egibacter rhizosphaerae]QBI18411.1 NAD-dependent epimerase/dehydratase family protein [Egibacter rhizosphaerae]